MLKNAGQYQQPTLGSQLYPVSMFPFDVCACEICSWMSKCNIKQLVSDIPKNSLYMFQGTANPTYQPVPHGNVPAAPIISQPGSVPGHTMPHVVAPTPSLKGFMPVNSAVVQRPGIGSMQPHSPTQAASVQPTITPAAPPPTVQTVDTSNVPGIYIYIFINFT